MITTYVTHAAVKADDCTALRTENISSIFWITVNKVLRKAMELSELSCRTDGRAKKNVEGALRLRTVFKDFLFNLTVVKS